MSALGGDKARGKSNLGTRISGLFTDGEAGELEGRDWIGNPDGTLVYWQTEAEDARVKLARIEELCTELETPGLSFGAAKRIRAILRGDA